jgi:hypothetical protein
MKIENDIEKYKSKKIIKIKEKIIKKVLISDIEN